MDYYNKLFQLFLSKYGTRYSEHVASILKEEFYEWLPSYKELTNEYRLYLINYIGIDLNDPFLAELDKGYVDTVIGKTAIMISPYAYTSFLKNCNFKLDDENKIILLDNNNKVLENDINLIISHNPYTNKTINNIKKISFNNDILLGMYGKIYDQDKKKKINKLKNLLEDIKNYEIDYNEKDDNYFCVLSKKK